MSSSLPISAVYPTDDDEWALPAEQLRASRTGLRSAAYRRPHCSLCGRTVGGSQRDLSCLCQGADVIYARVLVSGTKKWEFDGWDAKFACCHRVIEQLSCRDFRPLEPIDCSKHSGRLTPADALGEDLLQFIAASHRSFRMPAHIQFIEMIRRPWQVISSSMTSRSSFMQCLKMRKAERVPLQCKDTDVVDRYLKLLMASGGCPEPRSQQVNIGGLGVFTSTDALWGGYAVEFKTVRYSYSESCKTLQSRLARKAKGWLAQVACQQLLPPECHPNGNLLVLLMAPQEFMLTGGWERCCYLKTYIIKPENVAACMAEWQRWLASMAPSDLRDLVAYGAGELALHGVRGGAEFPAPVPASTAADKTSTTHGTWNSSGNAFAALCLDETDQADEYHQENSSSCTSSDDEEEAGRSAAAKGSRGVAHCSDDAPSICAAGSDFEEDEDGWMIIQ